MGLFFTNKDKTSVVEWFQGFQEKDHARSGFVATEEVVCKQGPLSQFTHTMEPQLRKLGLPTSLTKGVRCEKDLCMFGYCTCIYRW